jgi:predicted aspartyl protease
MKFGGAVVTLFLAVASGAQVQSEVPFQLIDGWAIVLEGTLGGVPHQRMLIDTGAVPSAINIKLARHLGLKGPSSGLSLMNRSINTERVHVPGVRLGPVAVESLDMVAMNLGRIEQALGLRIDAVVGLDLLARQNFSLDYRRKKIDFGTSTPGVWTIAFETKQEVGGTYILIPLESGGERIQVLLDTGTRDLMLFQRRLRGDLLHLHSRAQDFNLNAGGQDHLTEVELQSVQVGQLFRTKQKAYLWDTPESQLRTFDGLLGPASLGVTWVGFDFDLHVISFKIR